MRHPKTRRGQQTQAAIVSAAAELMYERGVRATSVGDVLARAGAGKGQLYHYFATKDDLIAAVLEHQLEQVLQQLAAFRLDTWAGIRAWFDALLEGQRTRAYRGCPVGSLSSEMAAASAELASRVAAAFQRWEDALTESLQRMRDSKVLASSARPRALARTTLAAIQGGYLVSAATRDLEPMRSALEMAYDHLRVHRSGAADERVPA
ncbi:MAG: TetR/AcrR family transcriptional regulator [Solirubrobacterales bacterium]|nr:TetR/AcrR family transcriptional regulator [Solirubrobacterales bacterium]